jgi:hypothetical protein
MGSGMGYETKFWVEVPDGEIKRDEPQLTGERTVAEARLKGRARAAVQVFLFADGSSWRLADLILIR